MSEREPTRSRRRIFDLRLMIGGVFVIYGVVLTVAGLLDTEEDLAKAGGLPINLWTGIGMASLGAFFLAWAKFGSSDAEPDPEETGGDERS